MSNNKKLAIIDITILMVSLILLGCSLWALSAMNLTVGFILSIMGLVGCGWLALGLTDFMFSSGNSQNDQENMSGNGDN
jgi:ABC-type transport system involved in multi-copper enzyme maturation permease subunit